MDLKEFFLKQKEAAHRATLEVLRKIPSQSSAWRPAEGMLTLGEIARHVWMSEEGTCRTALYGDWSYYERRIPQGLGGILGSVNTIEEELAQLERVNRQTLEQAADFPLERWEEERSNERWQIRRRVSVMLFGIVEHHIHHRAQVGTYLHILTGHRASHYAL